MLPENTRSYAKQKKEKRIEAEKSKLTQSVNKNSNCGGRQLIVAGAYYAGQKSEKELNRNVGNNPSTSARDGPVVDRSGILSQWGCP